MSALTEQIPRQWKARDRRRAEEVYAQLRAGRESGVVEEQTVLTLERALFPGRVTPAQARGYTLLALNVLGEQGFKVPDLPALKSVKPRSSDIRASDYRRVQAIDSLLAAAWDQALVDVESPDDRHAHARTLLRIAVATGVARVDRHLTKGRKKEHPESTHGSERLDGITHGSTPLHCPYLLFSDWLHRPLVDLDPWAQAETASAYVVPTGPGLALGLAQYRSRYPDVTCLAQVLGRDARSVLEELAVSWSTSQHRWTISGLSKAQSAYERLHLPQVLRLRTDPTFSWAPLSRPMLHRIVLGLPALPPPPASLARVAPLPRKDRARLATPAPTQAHKLLKSLASKLKRYEDERQASATQAVALLDSALGEPHDGLTRYLLLWLRSRLAGRNAIKASSAARYLSSLLPLVQLQGFQQLITKGPGAAHEIDDELWEEMLGDFTSASKDRDAPARLLAFHHFLSDYFPGLAQMDTSDIDLLDGYRVPRACVLTERELEDALERLDVPYRHARGLKLAAVIAFYAGLRRGELRRLRLDDLVDPESLRIRVLARLREPHKTPSAARELDLSLLLPPHLQKLLLQQVATLTARGCDGNQHLLGDGGQPLPNAAFDALTNALKSVTGDPHASTHSLRHSFITWNTLRILLADLPHLRSLPLVHRMEDFLTPWRSAPMLEGVLGRQDVPPYAFHLLAKRAGHASPRTALASYSHLHACARAELLEFGRPQPPLALLRRWSAWGDAEFNRRRDAARMRIRRLVPATRVPTPRAAPILMEMLYETLGARSPALPVNASAADPLTPRDVPGLITLLSATQGDVRAAGTRFDVPDTVQTRTLAEWSTLPDVFAQPHLREAREAFESTIDRLEQLPSHLTRPGLLAWSSAIPIRASRVATDDWKCFRWMPHLAHAVMPPHYRLLIDLKPFDDDTGAYEDAERGLAEWMGQHLKGRLRAINPLVHWNRSPKAGARSQEATLERHWMCLRIAAPPAPDYSPHIGFQCDEGPMVALTCAAALDTPPHSYNGEARDRRLRRVAKLNGVPFDERPPVRWRSPPALPDPDCWPRPQSAAA